jgi:hypothetical protein
MDRDYGLSQIADIIYEEAKLRLEESDCCPGGIKSKIHAVYMELIYALKERILK